MTAIILSYFQIYCELISNQTVWRRQADIIIVILLMQYYLFSFIVLFHNHYIILLWEYAIIIILIAIITLLHYYITIYYSGLIHLWTTSGIALIRRPFIIPQRFKPPSTCSGFAPGKRLSNWQTNRRTDSGLDSLAHEVFQHRALPGALPAHHGDLRQVEAGVLADGWEGILQPVYHRDKLLHPPVPHGGQIEEAGDGESERERQAGGKDAAADPCPVSLLILVRTIMPFSLSSMIGLYVMIWASMIMMFSSFDLQLPRLLSSSTLQTGLQSTNTHPICI